MLRLLLLAVSLWVFGVVVVVGWTIEPLGLVEVAVAVDEGAVILGSRLGLVALVELAGGGNIWRTRVAGAVQTIDCKARKCLVTTLSERENNKSFYLLDEITGAVLWDTVGAPPTSVAAVVATSGGNVAVAFSLGTSQIFLYSSDDKLLWSVDVPNLFHLDQVEGSSEVSVYSINENKILISLIDISTGTVSRKTAMTAPNRADFEYSTENYFFTNLFMTSIVQSKLVVHDFVGGEMSQEFDLRAQPQQSATSEWPAALTSAPYPWRVVSIVFGGQATCAVSVSNGIDFHILSVVLSHLRPPSVSLLRSLRGSWQSTHRPPTKRLAVAGLAADGLVIYEFDLLQNEERVVSSTLGLLRGADRGALRYAYSVGGSFLLSCADGTLALVRPINEKHNSLVWVRDESLGHIASTTFVDLDDGPKLPVKDNRAENTLIPKSIAKATWNRLLIVATKCHSLTALDSRDGTIAWRRSFVSDSNQPAFVTCDLDESQNTDPIHVHVLDSQTLLVDQRNGPAGARVAWLEAATGRMLGQVDRPKGKIVALPRGDKLIPVVVNLEENKINYLSIRGDALPLNVDENFHLDFLDGNKLKGWLVSNNSLVSSWLVDFDLANVNVIDATAPISSNSFPFHVLGDASVAYKFSSQNYRAILGSSSDGRLVFVLVNSINGEILANVKLPAGSSQPAKLAYFDNTAVITFWHADRQRHEATVIEMFHDVPDPGAFKILFGTLETPRSAPTISSATFVVPNSVAALGVTTSTLGITPRSVLFGTNDGQIVAVPTKFASGRRVIVDPKSKSQPLEVVEGLPPYSPLLTPPPQAVINKFIPIVGLSQIQSTPGTTEGSSIIVGHGIDLFVSTVQPAQHFDTLAPSFRKFLLSAVLIVFSLAASMSQIYRRRVFLLNKWR